MICGFVIFGETISNCDASKLGLESTEDREDVIGSGEGEVCRPRFCLCEVGEESIEDTINPDPPDT